MNDQVSIEQIFDRAIDLYRSYSLIHRRAISYTKYNTIKNSDLFDFKNLNTGDTLLRESLLEHVGVLPVLATFLYPYVTQKEKIDLGRVLIMLAVHDIGETVVGDGHPHKKTQEFKESEYKAALQLLPEDYHNLFTEYEKFESLDAKFAKAVDVFSTFVADLLLPGELVNERFKLNDFTVSDIEERRYKIFAWDSFLLEMFLENIKRCKSLHKDL